MDQEHLASFVDSIRRVFIEQRPDCVVAVDIRLSNRGKPIRIGTDHAGAMRKRLIVTTLRLHQAVSGPMRAAQIAMACRLKNNSSFRADLADLVLCECLVKNGGGYLVPDVLPEWFVRDF
jgi:hypothetical protein